MPEDATADGWVDSVLSLFATRGRTRYEEDVTQLEHALQAAALARDEAAPPALVVAALLHDLGHLLPDDHAARAAGVDGKHERAGSAFLARWLPRDVTGPIALHVAAKRYLVATDAAYTGVLSRASQRSLALQGGPMDATAIATFRGSAWADAAVRLRRWDDAAKVVGRAVPSIAEYRDVIGALVHRSP